MVAWDPKLWGTANSGLTLEAKINYVKAPQKAEELVSTPRSSGDTGKKGLRFSEVKRTDNG